MKKIKLVFFVKNIYERGGIPNVVSSVANILENTGRYDIGIISLFKTNSTTAYPLNSNIIVWTINHSVLNIKKNYLLCIRKIKSSLNNLQPDVFIVSGIGYFNICLIACRFSIGKHCRLLAWEHSCFDDWKFGGLAWLGYKSIKYYNELIVLTEKNKQLYQQKLKKISITKIYNPIELNKVTNAYCIDSKIIISAGDLIKRKGFDQIPLVGRKIFLKYPDWKWYIYGEGDERSVIETLIKKYNLQNNIFLKGYCSNLYNEMRKSSIFVSLARQEAFGMVIVEAQNNSLPVVAFDAQGPSEVIVPQINGFIVEKNNLDNLSEAILKLISNDKLRNSFSGQSRILFKNYSQELICSQWEDVIHGKE